MLDWFLKCRVDAAQVLCPLVDLLVGVGRVKRPSLAALLLALSERVSEQIGALRLPAVPEQHQLLQLVEGGLLLAVAVS